MPMPADFTQMILTLSSQSYINGVAGKLPGLAKRQWYLPVVAEIPLGYTSIQDPEFLSELVPRNLMNDAYVQAFRSGASNNAGRVGEVQALKSGIDYAAAYERSIHGMLSSRARCRAWATAKRLGHGDKEAGLFVNVKASLDSVIDAATNQNNTPP